MKSIIWMFPRKLVLPPTCVVFVKQKLWSFQWNVFIMIKWVYTNPLTLCFLDLAKSVFSTAMTAAVCVGQSHLSVAWASSLCLGIVKGQCWWHLWSTLSVSAPYLLSPVILRPPIMERASSPMGRQGDGSHEVLWTGRIPELVNGRPVPSLVELDAHRLYWAISLSSELAVSFGLWTETSRLKARHSDSLSSSVAYMLACKTRFFFTCLFLLTHCYYLQWPRYKTWIGEGGVSTSFSRFVRSQML